MRTSLTSQDPEYPHVYRLMITAAPQAPWERFVRQGNCFKPHLIVVLFPKAISQHATSRSFLMGLRHMSRLPPSRWRGKQSIICKAQLLATKDPYALVAHLIQTRKTKQLARMQVTSLPPSSQLPSKCPLAQLLFYGLTSKTKTGNLPKRLTLGQ